MANKPCVCGHSPTGKCIGWHDLPLESLMIVEKQYMEDNPSWRPARFPQSVSVPVQDENQGMPVNELLPQAPPSD